MLRGGEPFLHKDIARILSFATQILGRDRVSVTTNFSQFPVSKEGVLSLLRKCGSPGLNLSIDREHLRFDSLAPQRLSAIFAATSELKTNVSVISVAKSAREVRHRWPRVVSRIIPVELKERVVKNYDVGRREFFSNPKGARNLRKRLLDAKAGKSGALFMDSAIIFGGKPQLGLQTGVSLSFMSDGKLYIDTADALFAPQFSVGSWKRESLHDMVTHNLPFKVNMLEEWFGGARSVGRVKLKNGKYLGCFTEHDSKKAELFASYGLKRLDKLKFKRTGRH